ncbi:cytidine deaminase [Oscillospiraceae bacterium CM]|nr:cytidine deaminase [Oscillospiraceae bacterium CM]
MEYSALLKMAVMARGASYAPYSHFTVGAALLCTDGSVYTGANIENAAQTPTVCAERVAIFKAVSEGKRSFKAIAVSGGKDREAPDAAVSPCGVCRQVMLEFCDVGNFDVIVAGASGEPTTYRLDTLIPLAFGPEKLV